MTESETGGGTRAKEAIGLVVAVAVLAAVLASRVAMGTQVSPPAGPISDSGPSLTDLVDRVAGIEPTPFLLEDFMGETASVPGSARDGRPVPLGTIDDQRIGVEVSGLGQTRVSIVDLARSIERIEFRSGSDNGEIRYLPGAARYEITLIRRFNADGLFDDWHDDLASGGATRRTVTVVFFDEAGDETARFNLFNTFLSNLDVRNVGGVAIEQIELAVEGLELVRP
ncbi:MAG: phage tail protein [Planctomycetota bacterium]